MDTTRLKPAQFDLVCEMQWEDLIEFKTLESAGLENLDFDTVPATQALYYQDEM